MPLQLLFITTTVAACSMIYELLLAQCMTILYGHATSQYSLTIGLFLFSLGMGTLAYPYFTKIFDKQRLFVNVEILLCAAGALTPTIVFTISAAKFASFDIGYLFCHTWILLIGFLTGLEVPCLLDKGESLEEVDNNTFVILSCDFLGTFLGVILFVFFLYPYFGIVTTAALVGAANAGAALFLWWDSDTKLQTQLVVIVGLSIVLISTMISSQHLTQFLVSQAF